MTSNIVSHKKQNLVFGVGLNDACYVVRPIINGKQERNPFYDKWVSMLERCYSEKLLKIRQTYTGCSVTEEWHSFMAFKAWMEKQDWKGKHLDKDIIKPGNKVYSPDTCCFISKEINALLTNSAGSRGALPQGVSLRKENKRYMATISLYGKNKHLGLFDTPEDARAAYCVAKIDNIVKTAETQPEPIRSGLLRHAELFNKREETTQ